jgi:4-hydroxy-2-oxoheptanedioate aldolase
MKPNLVKQKLRAGEPSLGTWLSLGSVIAARFMATTGFDWLTVDTEHSPVSIETTATILGLVAAADKVALARVPANHHDHIKRVLDAGAMGVVVPMVNSRAEAEAAVAACKYPPTGNRSVGGSLHALNFATSTNEYCQRANYEVLVVLQCEHIDAVNRADEIFSVPGIDAIFVGPNDLEASMRGPDGSPPSAAATKEAMDHILATCRKYKVAAGLHTFDAETARQRRQEGWQFIAINSELRMMMDGAQDVLRVFGLDDKQKVAKY